MLGVSDKSWLVELLSAAAQDAGALAAAPAGTDTGETAYLTYFGLGHHIRLLDRPGVFKVSLAGMALGAYLLKGLAPHELDGRLLDVGTGSGALALLLRRMGARDITGTDLCAQAVRLAQDNERLNFDDSQVHFCQGDLFDSLPRGDQHDTIIFNPPGWRTPSPQLLDALRRIGDECDMAPESMFYGDQVLLRFLHELPARLHPRGRALVGLNSLVGIQDVFARYRAAGHGGTPLRFRLLERHSLPLMFYSTGWKRAEPLLREEFAHWRDRHGAAFTVDSQGRLYWSYEVVECTRCPVAPA